jgi:hypothetical protein
MNKLAVFLLAAIASNSALAREVGANIPTAAEPVTLAYAVAETGANNSEWALGPVNAPVTAAQYKQITSATSRMNQDALNRLSVELYERLEQDF